MNDATKAAQPLLPFTRPTIDEETIAAVAEVLRSGWLASGPKVAQLEAELSRYCGGRPVRSQTSATAGLEMALLACGIGPGDEVLTPALSFVATANVIMRVGARPVFVDVGLDSRNLDLEQVEAAITPRTRAIMPVHFAGLPVDMERLYHLAGQHQLRVIEDAAHAIGSSWRGRRIGSFGDLVCFSFHPNKNITTIEGGAISGGSPAEVKSIELHRWHGQLKTGADSFDTLLPGGSTICRTSRPVGLGRKAPGGNSTPGACWWRVTLSCGAVSRRCACRNAATRVTAGTSSHRCCRCRSCASRALSSWRR
jgi:dTDP-4-amino-4,6-dideoxygalactose transaminase